MSVDLTIKIITERAEREIAGTDTTILLVPPAAYVDVPGEEHTGEKAIHAGLLDLILRRLAEQQAADVGEELHHAEFTITRNPATLQSRGLIHDCDECRAGVQAGLRQLREHPDNDIIVGQLFWAAPT